MVVLNNLCNAQQSKVPITLAEACPSIDSAIMFGCVEERIASHASTKLLKQASSINHNSSVILKQIIENAFVAKTPMAFTTKTDLLSLNLKYPKYNMITFDKDVNYKLTCLEAVGHAC
jgi:hypothetical protein